MKNSNSDSSQKEIARFLMKCGFLVIRINSSKIMKSKTRVLRAYFIENNAGLSGEPTSSGHSDLVAYKNGKAYFLEKKRPKEPQSDDQKKFEKLVKSYGMQYHIIKSINDAYKFVRENT